MSITLRQARPEDAAAIYAMIYELAVYEKAPEEVVTTPEEIRETLFGAGSNTEALIAEYEGNIRLCRVLHQLFNLARTQRDLYGRPVRFPEYRGKGAGRALLKHIAQLAVNGSVVAWNGAFWTGTSPPLIFT
jgi:GNAT superfamily N-acetyltransferase